ncbi:tetratricopeptide repeat protein [Nonomuraea muscovyensis]|uniref:Tetratricopeptide repeat protein n=1 Tax=Nonomuraea muscovyensis TaxID=1124761 RepID=A0A7X0F144_9ACTN|nr:tetratricopeptide repeat protein [Nonomuraea muscovyensis]MBB6349189.1 hypothetical protein [Nonomuraea muscovyensis]MDF2704922.1 hypothetical protein [Nonomuraea muscovyensis]
MARNGSDDATRRDLQEVDAIEGLLAYAQTRSRWSRAAVGSVREAVRRSRALAGADPGRHTPLLARSLRAAAWLMLKRGRPGEALPPAAEAVALTRPAGGAPLVVCLVCLGDVYRALRRYDEAAAAHREAETTARADPG